MRKEFRLTFDQFFGPKSESPNVEHLLLESVASRGTIRMTIVEKGVDFEISQSSAGAAGITLTGRWRSPKHTVRSDLPGARLVAPFLFLIENMEIGPKTLTTCGRDSRTVADLMMRLYFNAAVRRMPIVLKAGLFHKPVHSASKQLAKTYHWLLRANLPDASLAAAEAPERFFVDAHVEIFGQETELLRLGLASFREDDAANDDVAAARRWQAAVLTSRTKWIQEFHHTQ